MVTPYTVHTLKGVTKMYLIKNKKSQFYQLVYFIGKKRTTVSAKTSIRSEAEEFLENFQKEFLNPKSKKFKIFLSQNSGMNIWILSRFQNQNIIHAQ